MHCIDYVEKALASGAFSVYNFNMAKTSYISIPSGLDIQYSQALQSGDRFTLPHVKVKRIFMSRSRKKGLTEKSLMVSLAPVWAGFSDTVKNAWISAGVACDMAGWRLFVQDTSKRISNSISGYATPSDLYQSMVGRITVQSPATGLTLLQLHPQTYFVNKKVVGTRSQYEPVQITETLSLPVDIAISYKSSLVSAGGSPRARFYIIIYSNYQGRQLENVCKIDFSLSHDWERLTASISSVEGVFTGYTAFIEIYNATGTLLFDNVEILHDSHNYARDPFCNSIETEFTKAFYQIPKAWDVQTIVDGAQFDSVYHDAV